MKFIGRTMLAAGAAALISAQAAYAAPRPTSAGVDPLVSVSVFGTTQSRAAVCGATTAAGGSCVMPGSLATAAATTAAAQSDQAYNQPRPQLGVLPLLIGLGLVIAVAAIILSGSGHGKGNLTPVSP
jgi:hypothetical protein